MKERSIFNMVIAIITAAIIIPLTVTAIVHHAHQSVLSVIFISIYYPVLLTHFILKAIYYGMDEGATKTVLFRLSKVFLDVSTSLIVVHFTLLMKSPIQWVLFAGICTSLIAEILLDSFDQLTEIKYLLSAVKAFVFIFILLTLYPINFLFAMILGSTLLLYCSNLLGRILKNKIILSFEIISILLFGIFLMVI